MTSDVAEPLIDLELFGRRLRHLRRSRGLTLAALGERVSQSPSQLSLLENGHREPKLSLVAQLARALDVDVAELVKREPPTRRAQLELEVAAALRDPIYTSLGLPPLRLNRRIPNDVLEHILGLYRELRRQRQRPTATPEEARAANAELRRRMRERGNYFPEIEHLAAERLAAIGYHAGALSAGQLHALVSAAGFTPRYVTGLPRSVRSITDLRHRRIYLERTPHGVHTHRTVLLQALGHHLLGHEVPRDYADFLRQRVEANYFAAAVLVPESAAVPYLKAAKNAKDLSVEDLRDVFAVSYEMAAHRFTNLATHHLDIPVHFVKNDETGTIYKAYENDGLVLPADADGAIEGQRMCRYWAGRQVFATTDPFSTYYQFTDTPRGTYWCLSNVDPAVRKPFAVTVGVPYDYARWFRGQDTRNRATSRCPYGECCQRPPADLAARWEGMAWPSARAHSHVLAVLPPGAFPGVDDADICAFLDRVTESDADT